MENQNFRGTNIDKIEYASVVNTSTLLRSVFTWMTVALIMTTIASMLFAFVPLITATIDFLFLAFIFTIGYKGV